MAAVNTSSRLDGTPIESIEPFTREMERMVKEMKEKLVEEKKILAWEEIPTYVPIHIEKNEEAAKEFFKNELSAEKEKVE